MSPTDTGPADLAEEQALDTTHTLASLTERFGWQLRLAEGVEAGQPIAGVATLSAAAAGEISFYTNPAYRQALAETRATAVILAPDQVEACPVTALISDNPYRDYARLASCFDRRPRRPAGIHPSAVVAEDVHLGQDVAIGPLVVIESGSRVGDRVRIGSGTVVGPNCEIGADSRLAANVTLAHGVRLGQRVILHSGAVLGADGFGLAFAGDHWEKVPQLGAVVVGDDCEIGANTTVDRGAIEDTVLAEDVRLDNQVQVAHNVRIGAHTAVAGCVGIAGSTTIGRYCMIGGATAIGGHLSIADKVVITGASSVWRSIEEAGEYGSVIPAQPVRRWHRILARLMNIDKLNRRINALERRLKAESNE